MLDLGDVVHRSVDVISKRMELRHLRYFVAVAEELNFRRAAERLHISQPPLTAQIQQLERILEVQLFERNKQRVLLTAAGRELLIHAERILADVAATRVKVVNAMSGDGGELRIGYTESAIYVGFILETIQRFRSERPAVKLTLYPMKSTAQLAALERGELDIGFVWALPDRPSTLLEYETIWDEPLMMAAPRENPLAQVGRRLCLADLAAEPFVTISRDSGALFFRTMNALCQTPEIAYEAPDLTTVLGLVASGAGVAIVPAAMQRLQTPGVVYRSISNDAHRAQLHWVSRRDANLPLLPLMRRAMFETASRQPAGALQSGELSMAAGPRPSPRRAVVPRPASARSE